jgi:hypothetical protein
MSDQLHSTAAFPPTMARLGGPQGRFGWVQKISPPPVFGQSSPYRPELEVNQSPPRGEECVEIYLLHTPISSCSGADRTG